MYLPTNPSSIIDFIEYLTSNRIMGSQRVERNLATEKQQQNNLKNLSPDLPRLHVKWLWFPEFWVYLFSLTRKEAQFWIPRMTVVDISLFMWAVETCWSHQVSVDCKVEFSPHPFTSSFCITLHEPSCLLYASILIIHLPCEGCPSFLSKGCCTCDNLVTFLKFK